MITRNVEVAIIGAGTAGLTARKQVSRKTDNYVVVDGGILGTTCARVGCMPSKVLIQVANDFHRRRVFEDVGIQGASALTIDHRKVMQHVRKLRDRFVKSVMKGSQSWMETHFIAKHASFIDKNTLDLGDEKIVAQKIIIATGSHPVIPQAWSEFRRFFWDTDSFFEAEEFPQSMAVVGLGVIGIELGQALHRLGVDIIGIGLGPSIAGLTDPDLVDYTAKTFAEEMRLDFTGVESMREADGKLLIKTKEREYAVDKALLAVGRSPNIEKLGLAGIGIATNSRGMPDFSASTLAVKDAPLFIAGDVNIDRPLLHEAADEGAVAGYNAVVDTLEVFKRRTFLGITFSSPNIATIGKSYKSLCDDGVDFAMGEVSFEGQGRAIVKMAEKGLLKVYGCKQSSRILGAELCAPAGEHLAHLLAWVIAKEMTVQEVLALPFYHPAVEEGLRTSLRALASQLLESRPSLELATCVDHLTNNCGT